MNAKILSLITLLATTTLAQAENHLMIIGGGGEPVRDHTIFDSGMKSLGENLKKANWKYDVSFNGGHRDTEDILRKYYSKSATPTSNFTQDKYVQMIENYKKKILSGEIKSGDQIMIIIHTHGASQGPGQMTHKISTTGGTATDLDNLSGSKLVSVDALAEIVKLTNERGIKLGIADLSCHSGNTLALKKNAPNTCIISSSGPVHYGFAGTVAFTDQFLDKLTPGTSLEEAFLKARLNSKDAAYPMISTDENDAIVKDVYDSITPYLYYYNQKTDKLTPYILEAAKPEQMCKREEDFKKLISKIDGLNSVMKSKKNSFNADALKDLLTEYKASQDKVIKSSMAMGGDKLDRIETFTIPPKAASLLSRFKLSYTWKELIDLDVDKNIADYERFKKFSESKDSKDKNQAVIDFLKTVNAKKQQIIAQNSQMKDYKESTRELVKQMSKSQDVANKIALQEKVFYEELYRRNQKDSNDPCKKIVF